MSGNKQGGIKARETNKKRYGDDFYRNIGQIGGSTPKKTPHGWLYAKLNYSPNDPRHPSYAGRLGGRKSRRIKDEN